MKKTHDYEKGFIEALKFLKQKIETDIIWFTEVEKLQYGLQKLRNFKNNLKNCQKRRGNEDENEQATGNIRN